MSTEHRAQFREQANHIIEEAWEINGAPGTNHELEIQLRILNGLLAIAIAEVFAPPRSGPFGSAVHLSQVMAEPDKEDTPF